MIKRIVALLLAVLSVLSVFAILPVAAASQSDINLLVDLGIIEPVQTAGLIKKTYSRAKFAATLALMGRTQLATYDDYSKYATDIEKSENRNSIVESIQRGLIQTEGGKFYPDANLTKKDAVYALVKLLQYDALAQYYGSKESDYYRIATQTGLFKGVTIANDKMLTQDETARLVLNAMSIRFLEVGSVSYGNDECLFDLWNIIQSKGTIRANSNLGMMTPKTPKNSVNIDGYIYQTEVPIEDVWVGSKVTYYIREVDGERKIVSVWQNQGMDTVSINAMQIESFTDTGNVLKLVYNDNKEIKISKTGYAMVNNHIQSPDKNLFDYFKNGTATFIDSNKDGLYEVVHMNLLKIAVIKGISSQAKALVTDYANEVIDLDEPDNVEIYINKKSASFDSLKPGMVIGLSCDSYTFQNGNLVFDYKAAGTIKIFASNRTESGYVVSIDDSYICTEDMDYKIGQGYKDLVANKYKLAVKPGSYITLLMDCYGYLADYKIDAEKGMMHYGYLIAAGKSGSNIAPEVKFHLLDEQGNFHLYNLAEKIILDGLSVQMDANSLRYSVGDGTVDFTKRQLIRYRLEEDKIKEVDTEVVRDGYENKEFSLTKDLPFDPYSINQPKYTVQSSVISRRYAFSKGCVVFVDEADINDTAPNEKNFTVGKVDSMNSADHYMSGYDTNDMNEISCVVRYDSYNQTGDQATTSMGYYVANCYVVGRISQSINDKGEEGYTIQVAGENKIISAFAPVDSLKLYEARSTSDWGRENINLYKCDPGQLAAILRGGDVIRFKTNAYKEIVYIEKLFDFSTYQNSIAEIPDAGGQIFGFVKIERTNQNNVVYSYNQSSDQIIYVFQKRSLYTSVPVYHVGTGKITLENDYAKLPSADKGDTVRAFLRYYNNGSIYDYIFYVYD